MFSNLAAALGRRLANFYIVYTTQARRSWPVTWHVISKGCPKKLLLLKISSVNYISLAMKNLESLYIILLKGNIYRLVKYKLISV